MKELATIQAKLNAPKGQFNAFGKYKYRSCEDVLQAVKPLLKETDTTLTITDDIILVGNRIYVKATATLKNAKGDTETTTAFAREEDTKKGMDASQVTGAASSYARKYALNGLFAIDDNKDSDVTNTHGKDAASAMNYTKEQLDEALKGIKNAKTESKLLDLWRYYAENIPSLTAQGTEFFNAWVEKRTQFANQQK